MEFGVYAFGEVTNGCTQSHTRTRCRRGSRSRVAWCCRSQRGGRPSSKRVAIEGVTARGPPSTTGSGFASTGRDGRVASSSWSRVRPAGQGGFAWIAQDIVDRVDGLAVWALRTADRTRSRTPRRSSSGTADEAFSYYLGGGPVRGQYLRAGIRGGGAVRPRVGGRDDARGPAPVVLEACDARGGCVILGGHSFGAVTVPAYAVWDFNGRPGFRDVDGLVMVDGGLFNAFANLLPDDGFPAVQVGRRGASSESRRSRRRPRSAQTRGAARPNGRWGWFRSSSATTRSRTPTRRRRCSRTGSAASS